MSSLSNAAYRPPGSLNLRTALRPFTGRWTLREAAHLARRAGFGADPAHLQQLSESSMAEAVTSYVSFASTAALAAAPPSLVDPRSAMTNLSLPLPADRAAVAKARNAVYHDDFIALQSWWLERMVQSPAPLQEKMTLFWHGHFTTAYREKGVTPQLILAQNQLFRSYALGDIRALTVAVSQDPAMLYYLDNARSTKAHPNENYARELMELFTLGIGHYTEQDVRGKCARLHGLDGRPRQSLSHGGGTTRSRLKNILGPSG